MATKNQLIEDFRRIAGLTDVGDIMEGLPSTSTNHASMHAGRESELEDSKTDDVVNGYEDLLGKNKRFAEMHHKSKKTKFLAAQLGTKLAGGYVGPSAVKQGLRDLGELHKTAHIQLWDLAQEARASGYPVVARWIKSGSRAHKETSDAAYAEANGPATSAESVDNRMARMIVEDQRPVDHYWDYVDRKSEIEDLPKEMHDRMHSIPAYAEDYAKGKASAEEAEKAADDWNNTTESHRTSDMLKELQRHHENARNAYLNAGARAHASKLHKLGARLNTLGELHDHSAHVADMDHRVRFEGTQAQRRTSIPAKAAPPATSKYKGQSTSSDPEVEVSYESVLNRMLLIVESEGYTLDKDATAGELLSAIVEALEGGIDLSEDAQDELVVLVEAVFKNNKGQLARERGQLSLRLPRVSLMRESPGIRRS